MASVKINGRDYDLETLSDEAKSALANVSYCDDRIKELQRDLAMAQTARSAYANALARALPKDN
jgi:hypothetical protein